MIKICIILLIIHWSQQYVIRHEDKSDTKTEVENAVNGQWAFSSRTSNTNSDTGDQITFKAVSGTALNREYKYNTSKGTFKEEEINIAKNEGIPSFKGKYSYEGDDGIRYIFSYIADKNGYQPKVLFGKNVQTKTTTTGRPATYRTISPTNRPVGGDCLNTLLGGGCL